MAAPMDNAETNSKTLNSPSKTTDIRKTDDLPVNGYAFILGTASISLLFGFGAALYTARRKDASLFRKIIPQPHIPDDGPQLATKALGYATVISVSSCGLLVFGVFKLMGVNNITEFGVKLREYFPKKEPVGRSEFESLRDLADYLVSQARQDDIDKKNKEMASKDKS